MLRALKVHLIGIGGTGMGAFARMLHDLGHEVRGSDAGVYPPMSTQLAAANIPVAPAFDPANLDWQPDRVVVGNVCSANHTEVVAAQARHLQLVSFPSLLAELVLEGRRPLVIAGTHGKTTTSSLVAWILAYAGRDPSFLIGGVPQNFASGSQIGRGDAVVVEGDEYDTAFFDKKSKFLHYRPQRAIITGVEYDHADIFENMDAIRSAFREFASRVPSDGDLIVALDDSEAMGIAAGADCNIVTYRVLPEGSRDVSSANYCLVPSTSSTSRRPAGEVFEQGTSLGVFSTHLVGGYNLSNVLAAVAMARREGVAADVCRDAVARFRGVRRRQELLGIAQGVRVIQDFAHHPTAVSLVVKAMRRRYPDHALRVCFEPRSATSRRNVFFDAYIASFDAATAVYFAPLHRPEKVPADQRLDTVALASQIAKRGPLASAFPNLDALREAVFNAASPGDTVLLLSSGDFGGLGDQLLREFGDPVVFVGPDEQQAVHQVLDRYQLPLPRGGPEVETLAIRSSQGVVGCVSLEVSGRCGFLFNLAVAPERRGEGLGWVLGDCVLKRARSLGAAVVYLLAGTAADFFASKLGFQRIDVSAVDADIRKSANFAAAASGDNVVCMVLELAPETSQA